MRNNSSNTHAHAQAPEKRPGDHLPLTRVIEGAAMHLAELVSGDSPLNADLLALKRVLMGAAGMAREMESRAVAEPAPETRRDLVYLACPYSHRSPMVRRARVVEASYAAVLLMRQDVSVFSPLSHGSLIQEFAAFLEMELAGDAATWAPLNDAILAICDRVVVLNIEGCFDSVGVRHEVALAARLGKPVDLLTVDHANRVLSVEVNADPMLWSDKEGRL